MTRGSQGPDPVFLLQTMAQRSLTLNSVFQVASQNTYKRANIRIHCRLVVSLVNWPLCLVNFKEPKVYLPTATPACLCGWEGDLERGGRHLETPLEMCKHPQIMHCSFWCFTSVLRKNSRWMQKRRRNSQFWSFLRIFFCIPTSYSKFDAHYS